MKIHPRKSTDAPSYPTIESLTPRLGLLAGMGLVIVTAGCPWDKGGVRETDPPIDTQEDTGRLDSGILGDVAYTYDGLLPQNGSRTVDFASPEGWIGYHLVVQVYDQEFLSWLEANAPELLARVDAALLQHPITDFANANHVVVEQELVIVLGAAWDQATGNEDGRYRFEALALMVDSYEATDQIDGDIGP